jgi:uncharacterized membrane protein
MFLLDPARGRRRRALLRDKAVHLAHEAADAAEVTAHDMAHRARGAMLDTRRVLRERTVDDRVLSERVRSRLGRIVSHPHALHVDVNEGRVTLGGLILSREADCLVSRLSGMHGVMAIEDRLERHEHAGDVPALQGESRRPAPRLMWFQRNWSPTARLLAGAAGAALVGGAVARPHRWAIAPGVVGGVILLRALLNRDLRRIFGIGAGRWAVDFHKNIYIDAPRPEVFAYFRNFEHFPRFMSHLRHVRVNETGLSHWVAVGPAGWSVSWDGELAQVEPDRIIAWRSVTGSMVETAGIVRFETVGNGTRLDIRLQYNPPGGAIGHAVAALFGKDPKRAMDDDLARFKTLMEVGKARGRGEQVTREELVPPEPRLH